MKVLITGIAGLLGSRLADWIIENKPGITVLGIDDFSGGYIENVNEEAVFYELNLAAAETELDTLFKKERPDVVYHFAA